MRSDKILDLESRQTKSEQEKALKETSSRLKGRAGNVAQW
jgi:hypothetical protein